MGGGGRKKSRGRSEPAQPDWAAIFAQERAAQDRIMQQQRAEAEAQRQREAQQRAEEEAKRVQEEHNVQQKARDEQAMSDYTTMKQAAAAQAVGGVGSVTPASSRATAPGLAPTTTTQTQRPVSSSTYSPAATGQITPMAGNLPAAPQGVGLGGSLNWLQSLYGR